MTDNEERIAQLEQELALVRQTLREESDRVLRMKRSASWRLTMPLRALRRTLIDPFTNTRARANVCEPRVKDPKPCPASSLEATQPPSHDPPPPYRDYSDYCKRMQPLVETYCSNFSARLDQLAYKPLISIIFPVYNPDLRWLKQAIDSVTSQVYPYWELCIADDASPSPKVRELIEEYRLGSEKVKVAYREKNGHISEASNSALQLASGDYIALLDHDDLLTPHALARVVDTLNQSADLALIYSDEDKIDETGNRSQPHFKSDWNPDLLTSQNFISHLGIYKRSIVLETGGFRKGVEGAQDWDLALRIIELSSPSQIHHIPEVLYHWRAISGSTAKDIDEKNYAHQAARKVLSDHFNRSGIEVSLEPVDRYYWRPRYSIPNPPPSVAIVIPTRDQIELLKSCIESILSNTTYPNFTVVVVDNDSENAKTLQYLEQIQKQGVEVVRSPGAFNFAKLNNEAIRSRNEPLVCLLNNDTSILSPEWLEELVMHGLREEIGPVGAKLLYPHDHVQHAGIVLGIGGVASEAFKRIHKTDDGYIHRAFLPSNFSAVTGACMLFRKSVWKEVGGFDERNVPNAFGDVDFCLRCGEKGYRSLFTPFAQLVHHESASRGDDLLPGKAHAFKQAVAYMEETWGNKIRRDPYYNPNLTLAREDFTLAHAPRDYSTA